MLDYQLFTHCAGGVSTAIKGSVAGLHSAVIGGDCRDKK